MKNAFLIAVCLFVSTTTFARPAGQMKDYELSCSSPQAPDGSPLLGVGYSLTCDFLASELLGCDLFKSVVYPGAKPEKIDLQLTMQNSTVALLYSKDGVSVELKKQGLVALVRFTDATMKCAP